MSRRKLSKEQIHVRHCNIDDREAVLDIDRNIYGGFDYLPAVYKTYCDDPLRYHHVLEVDGKIVSYFSSTLVDECHAVYICALRTSPDFRGLGLAGMLMKQGVAELRSIYPNLTEVLMGSGVQPSKETFITKGSTVIINPYFYINIESSEALKAARGAMENSLTDSVSKIPFEMFTEYLRAEDVRKVLQQNQITLLQVVYNLDIASNFQQPFRFPDEFYLSRDKDGSVNGVSFFQSLKAEDKNMNLHEVEIYCHTEEVATALLACTYKEILRNVAFTNVWFAVFYPYSLRESNFEALAHKMLCLPKNPDPEYLVRFYSQNIDCFLKQ